MSTADDDEKRIAMEIDGLKNKRRGMKGGITKRIKLIKGLVNENGSRSQIKFLLSKLHEGVNQTRTIADQVIALTSDSSDTLWIEEIDSEVDLCTSVVKDYLKSREEDPDSVEGLTASWIRQHTDYRDVDTTSQVSHDFLPDPLQNGAYQKVST